MSDPYTTVWTFAKPYIEAGKVTPNYVRRACEMGLAYKGGWERKVMAQIKAEAEREPYAWEKELRHYRISIEELGLLHAMQDPACTWGVADLRSRISDKYYYVAIARFEERGWIKVQRDRANRILKITPGNIPPPLEVA